MHKRETLASPPFRHTHTLGAEPLHPSIRSAIVAIALIILYTQPYICSIICRVKKKNSANNKVTNGTTMGSDRLGVTRYRAATEIGMGDFYIESIVAVVVVVVVLVPLRVLLYIAA